MPKKTKGRDFANPPAQVIVILKEDTGPVLRRLESTEKIAAAPEAALQKTLSGLGASLVPLFGETENHVAKLVARAVEAVPPARQANIRRMSSFYTLSTAPKADLEKVISNLNKLDIVEGAYIKPRGSHRFIMRWTMRRAIWRRAAAACPLHRI